MQRIRPARRRILALILLLSCAFSGAAAAALPLRQSFDLQVPAAPTPVTVDGTPLLAYELHLSNFAEEALALRRVDIRDAADGAVIASFADDALALRLARPGTDARTDETSSIAPGMRGVLYLELTSPAGAMPKAIDHRIEYRTAGDAMHATLVIEGGRTTLATRPPVVIGAPLRGGPWVAIHAASWPRGHRRMLYAVDGHVRIPGRFAVDWVRLDANGRSTHDDADRVENSYGHGAEVLAVADAVVAATRADMLESATISAHPKHAIGDATGNYVALDLGDGRFAFYEHLEPGSLRVVPGQHVRRGEVIAALGFSGDSTGPHLHFHVADAPSPLGAEGLPFVLERFRVLGRYPDIGALDRAPWTPLDRTQPSQRECEWPASNVVVEFE